jgi:fibronectin-binding autotransporter adhesin
MKNKFSYLFAAIFGGAVATTSVLGQATYTWIGTLSGGDGTNINTPANWTTNEPGDIPAVTTPSGSDGGTGDIAQWDNQSPPLGGVVNCTYNNGLPSTGGGTFGLNFALTANQTANVQLHPVGGATGNIGFNTITVNSTAGTLILGDGTGNANTLNLVLRPGNAGQIHDFVNNSATPAVVYPNVRWQSGGGILHIFDFDGSGNWLVTNNLAMANGAGDEVEKSGTGTMFWNGPSTANAAPNSTINSPFTINAGRVVLQWNDTQLNGITILNEGYLQFNAPGQGLTLIGAISGVGTNEVNAGTLTLEGASTYTGNTVLNGGELIIDGAEAAGNASGPLGEGGLITFAGGTLGWSAANTYDYSPRFDTSAGQQYSLDTEGQNVTLTNNLTSTGGATLTKLNPGVLTLTGANSYSGLTTIAAGKLQIQGSASTGNITVNNGAALGVYEGGAQIKPTVLTVGTTGSATLEFNNVSSLSTPALVAGSISAGGPITVNVNSGVFTSIGQVFPLFSWSGGSPPPVALGLSIGASGSLSTNGNTIDFTVTSLQFVWTGLNSGNWDISTPNNWKLNGASATFQNGGGAVFDDTAPGTTNVNVNAAVLPASVIFNNNSLIYTVTSSGLDAIGGSGSLTKNGTQLATLSGGTNSYTGPTTISGGVLSIGVLANSGSDSDIGAAANGAANLVFNGGSLRYTGSGPATSDHLFTLGTGGGILDDEGGGMTLGNPGTLGLTGSGTRILTLSGSDSTGTNTLSGVLGDQGGATLITKLGASTWVLTGLNTDSGAIAIDGGTLQVGNGGNSALGSGNVVDDGSLNIDAANTVSLGTISGAGSFTNSGTGTTIMLGNNTYLGDTYITGGTLQLGNGGAAGSITPGPNAAILDNSLLVFNSTGTVGNSQNFITGTGNLIVEGGGFFGMYGQPATGGTYTGWTFIAAGSTYQPCKGQGGVLDSSVVTNNGELLLVRQDNAVFIYPGDIVGTGMVVKGDNNPNTGDVTLTGTNTYTGGTLIDGGSIILGDNSTLGAGSIVGGVTMEFDSVNQVNSTLEFNRPDSFIFTNTIVGLGNVLQDGSGTVILTGNNTYTNSITTVSVNTTIQVGNGGTTGSVSVDNVTDNGTLVFDRSDSVAAGNLISGTGFVIQEGSGTLTLGDTNFYTGDTVLSNGTLIVSGQSSPNGVSETGNLDIDGTSLATTFVSGSTTQVFSNTITGTMNINGGSLAIVLNKVPTQLSNTFYVASGGIVNSSSVGTPAQVVVANVGPLIVAGDTFTIFNGGASPTVGAQALSISSPSIPGVTWLNNLASSGSITAQTSETASAVPAKITKVAVSGSTLTFSATNGVAGGQYVLLQTTNLSPPIVWTPVFTNTFDGSGNIVNLSTNIITAGKHAQFFNVSQP